MNKEQKFAFEYGQAASESACLFAPSNNPRMHKLVSETRTETGHRHNHKNICAWYMGYLSQTALAGNGISQEMFGAALTVLIHGEPKAVPNWLRFADEYVNLGHYVDFEQKKDHTVAVNRWLETLISGLLEIQKQYGTRIAKQVYNLSLLPSCLYPNEMIQAAVYFQNGGAPEEISAMIASGSIEGEQPFFPKLTDEVGKKHSCSSSSIDLQIKKEPEDPSYYQDFQ